MKFYVGELLLKCAGNIKVWLKADINNGHYKKTYVLVRLLYHGRRR